MLSLPRAGLATLNLLAAGSQFSSPCYYQTQPPKIMSINIQNLGSLLPPASSLGTPCHPSDHSHGSTLVLSYQKLNCFQNHQYKLAFSPNTIILDFPPLLKKPIAPSMKNTCNKLFSQLPTITSHLPLLFESSCPSH